MSDFRDIDDARCEAAAAVAGQWTSTGGQLKETAGGLRETARFDGWSGEASHAMRHRVDSSANRADAAGLSARWTGTVLSTHVTALRPVRATVRAALAAASVTTVSVAVSAAVTATLQACRGFVTGLDAATGRTIDALCAVDAPPEAQRVDFSAPAAAAAVAELTGGDGGRADHSGGLADAVDAARTALALRGLDPDAVGVSVQEVAGTASVVVGDIRTAEKVTTLVSGVGSSAEGATTGSAASAGRIGGPGHAVVAWHGYTAPPGLVSGATPSAADRGAPGLRNLQSTLRRDSADGAELQIVGHSYGSTLVGAAARDPSEPLDADTVHLIGSPGTGHRHAGDMQVGPSTGDGSGAGGGSDVGAGVGAEIHAWRAPGDLIGMATGAVGGVHGVDPTSPRFGADTVGGAAPELQGGAGGRIVDRMTDGYLWLRGEWDSHSSYLSDEQFLQQVR